MHVLVLEAVCAGLCGDSSSLLREGAAMWRSVVEDFRRVPGVEVTTCLSATLQRQLALPSDVECFRLEQPPEWSAWWDEAVATADKVLVIAPETGGMLSDLVATAGTNSLNCSVDAILLCGDKLRLAEHCQRYEIPTIPTVAEDWETPPRPDEYPCLIKPRDGAGCALTFAVPNVAAWKRISRLYANEPVLALRQPSISARHLSVAAIFHDNATPEIFPVGEQQIEIDGRGQLSYAGGGIPANVPADVVEQIDLLVLGVARAIPGLRGYIGLDFLLPHSAIHHPVLVEINPRLTTSYVGYRRLCEQNLAEAMLGPAGGPLTWRHQSIAFDASGAEISSRSTAGW